LNSNIIIISTIFIVVNNLTHQNKMRGIQIKEYVKVSRMLASTSSD